MRKILFVAASAALLAGAGVASAQQTQPSAADVVKSWDKNGDGSVDKTEWTAAGRPADRFDAVDANKDGKISADELDKAMAAMRQQQKPGGGN